jgi:hypothetical protein
MHTSGFNIPHFRIYFASDVEFIMDEDNNAAVRNLALNLYFVKTMTVRRMQGI